MYSKARLLTDDAIYEVFAMRPGFVCLIVNNGTHRWFLDSEVSFNV